MLVMKRVTDPFVVKERLVLGYTDCLEYSCQVSTATARYSPSFTNSGGSV